MRPVRMPTSAFLGDSITRLVRQDAKFGGFFPGKPQYADRGISGQTTPQMLLRFRSDVIALSPGVVVILAGTNDIAGNAGPETNEDIEGYLTSMCELARAPTTSKGRALEHPAGQRLPHEGRPSASQDRSISSGRYRYGDPARGITAVNAVDAQLRIKARSTSISITSRR